MRILQIVHGFPPQSLGGVEVFSAELCESLARRGHAVEVISFDPSRDKADNKVGLSEREEMKVWTFPKPSRKAKRRDDGPIRRHFQDRLASFKPELVHFQHLERMPTDFPSLARSAGAKVVIHLHDFWWMCPTIKLFDSDGERCQRPRARKCLKCVSGESPGILNFFRYQALRKRPKEHKKILQAADLLICPGEQSRLTFLERFSAPKDRTIVLPSLIPLAEPLPKRSKPQGGPLRIGIFGAISREKGIAVAAEAVLGSSAELELQLHGVPSHDFVEELEEILAKGAGKIQHCGSYNREELSERLAGLDIVLAPSLWNETYGIVVDEARRAGLPVVASRVGGMQERLLQGRSGVLVEPGDVAALRAELEAFSRNYSEKVAGLRAFEAPDYESFVSRVEAHYLNLCAAQPVAPIALDLDEQTADFASFRGISDEDARAQITAEILDPNVVKESWEEMNPKSNEEIENFYKRTEAYVLDLTACHSTAERRLWTKVSLDILCSEPGIEKVLDYGGGAGYDSAAFAREGFSVSYYDLPSKTAEYARHRFSRRSLDIPVNHSWDSIPENFDAIYSTEVLEHIPEPLKHLEFLASRLREGGLLIVTHSFALVGDEFPSHLPANAPLAEGFIARVEALGFRFLKTWEVPGNEIYVFHRRALIAV
jgi:glycosyltransferase involved in cell wall biosynthesis/2-polyprenyl-3-methyl-5-hydroxy-6-metoxy-1,4-benzoquinol methylase